MCYLFIRKEINPEEYSYGFYDTVNLVYFFCDDLDFTDDFTRRRDPLVLQRHLEEMLTDVNYTHTTFASFDVFKYQHPEFFI